MSEQTLARQELMPLPAGRTCPLRYRYGAGAIARAPEVDAPTLYVVGGLYGNVPALDAVEAMARAESPVASLCFNGDFNWFNCDDTGFEHVNSRVLSHAGTLGNVEAELGVDGDEAGCGCAYPESVDSAVVERSNQIHAVLKATASRHPALLERLSAWPMIARYRVGRCRVGVVHGDADSLAGWRFDAQALGSSEDAAWRQAAFAQAQVDVFASSHTCLPALRCLGVPGGAPRIVANNGAAGMPNFAGHLFGLCVRVGLTPSPHEVIREHVVAGAFVALLPVRYDTQRWETEFLANWPPGSAAWLSYCDRISRGPNFSVAQALGL